jgi:hypothetical protein
MTKVCVRSYMLGRAGDVVVDVCFGESRSSRRVVQQVGEHFPQKWMQSPQGVMCKIEGKQHF